MSTAFSCIFVHRTCYFTLYYLSRPLCLPSNSVIVTRDGDRYKNRLVFPMNIANSLNIRQSVLVGFRDPHEYEGMNLFLFFGLIYRPIALQALSGRFTILIIQATHCCIMVEGGVSLNWGLFWGQGLYDAHPEKSYQGLFSG